MGNDWYYKLVKAGSKSDTSSESSSESSSDDEWETPTSDDDEPGTLISGGKLPSIKNNYYFDIGDGTLTSIVKQMTQLLASINDPLLENDYTDLPIHPDQKYSSEQVPKELYGVQERLEAISTMAYLASEVAPATIREQILPGEPVDDDRDAWRIKLDYW